MSRELDQLLRRIEALERELAGMRSERRARLRTKQQQFKGVVTQVGGISAGSSGEVTIWQAGAATTWKVTAHLNWMHNGKACANGDEVILFFFADENKFVITNGECES